MSRTKLFAVVIVVAVIVASSSPAQSKNPLEGTWKANLEKSQRDPKHLFESVTLRFEVSGDTVSMTFNGVNMSGEQESGTRKFHPDGKEYPVAEAPGIVEVSKWVGPNALETVAKKDGKVVGQSTYEVSSDGKTLTAKIKGIDESGATFEQVIVFDRQ
jgi:hypothetical protein